MATLTDSPLAMVLAAHRDRYNSRFAMARRQNRTLSRSEFAAHLAGPIDRIARALHASSPTVVDPVCHVLIEISLDLFARGILGENSRRPITARAWEDLLLHLLHLLPDHPRRLAARLCNALNQLEGDDPQLALRWQAALLDLAPHCASSELLLQAGQVLAWRCGKAAYRASALTLWRTLPDDLRLRTLGLDPNTPCPALEAIEAGLANPWYDPMLPHCDKPRIAARVGGFLPFEGGAFLRPPLVDRAGSRLVAYDNDRCYTLYADAYGASLCRAETPRDMNTVDIRRPHVSLSDDGVLQIGSKSWSFPALESVTSWARVGNTLAVSLEHSHFIMLIALPPETA